MKHINILLFILAFICIIPFNVKGEEVETTKIIESENKEQTSAIVKWHKVTFIDTYNKKNKVINVENGKKIEEYIPKLPEGIRYCGWKLDDDKEFDFSSPITEDIQLTLKYMEISIDIEYIYQVVFDYNYADKTEMTNIKTFNKNTLIDETVNPKRLDYKFLGWYTEKTKGKKWNFNRDTINSGLILYAHWEYVGTESNISPQTGYNANRAFAILIMCLGTAVFSSVKLSYKKVILRLKEYEKTLEDYNRLHIINSVQTGEKMKNKLGIFIIAILILFCISSNIKAEEMLTSESIEKITESEQITTAPTCYTITFIDEIRHTCVKKTIKKGETLDEILVSKKTINVGAEKYIFMCWNIEKTNEEFDFSKPVEENLELYAHYTKMIVERNNKMYTVTLNAQNNTNYKTSYVEEGKTIKNIKVPKKRDYKFSGWYTKHQGGKKWNINKDKIYKDMTLYAHWEYVGTGNNVSPQTGYDISIAFEVLLLCFAIATISSIKLRYNN